MYPDGSKQTLKGSGSRGPDMLHRCCGLPCLRGRNNIQESSRGLQKTLEFKRTCFTVEGNRGRHLALPAALERCHGFPEDFESAFGCSEVLLQAIVGSRIFGDDAGGSQKL